MIPACGAISAVRKVIFREIARISSTDIDDHLVPEEENGVEVGQGVDLDPAGEVDQEEGEVFQGVEAGADVAVLGVDLEQQTLDLDRA